MSRFKSMDVEENVACNLIPMIDIMFLLLLFFMLSADMTQRTVEDVKLPIAEQAKEDPKQKEGYETTTVNLIDEGNGWVVKIQGKAYPDWAVLKTELSDLAKSSPEPNPPPGQFFSSRAISLRADAAAPYKECQRLIQLCSSVGLYKIEIGAAKPAPDAPPAK
jgi:biopolymer transport protein ExbD